MDKKIIGIDLGGTTVKFAVLTSEGEIQQKWSIDTNILDEGSHIVPEIIASINHRLDLYGKTSLGSVWGLQEVSIAKKEQLSVLTI